MCYDEARMISPVPIAPVDWTTTPLPPETAIVIDDLQWGNVAQVGTPAFWAYVTARDLHVGLHSPGPVGDSLREEVAACLLCGHGVKSEVGLAYFDALRDRGMIRHPREPEVYEAVLRTPIAVEERMVRYRFPRVKARQLSEAMSVMSERDLDALPDLALRMALMDISGIGPKTSAFIVRNYRSSDEVAILDVHVVRCGKYTGFFRSEDDPARSYCEMEQTFVRFARAIGTRPSHLDNVMWTYGRELAWIFAESP